MNKKKQMYFVRVSIMNQVEYFGPYSHPNSACVHKHRIEDKLFEADKKNRDLNFIILPSMQAFNEMVLLNDESSGYSPIGFNLDYLDSFKFKGINSIACELFAKSLFYNYDFFPTFSIEAPFSWLKWIRCTLKDGEEFKRYYFGPYISDEYAAKMFTYLLHKDHNTDTQNLLIVNDTYRLNDQKTNLDLTKRNHAFSL